MDHLGFGMPRESLLECRDRKLGPGKRFHDFKQVLDGVEGHRIGQATPARIARSASDRDFLRILKWPDLADTCQPVSGIGQATGRINTGT